MMRMGTVPLVEVFSAVALQRDASSPAYKINSLAIQTRHFASLEWNCFGVSWLPYT